MASSPTSKNKAANVQETGGTPDEASLNVRWLNDEWIVESNLGETLAKSRDKDHAVAMARFQARRRTPGIIKVLDRDGNLEQTIDP